MSEIVPRIEIRKITPPLEVRYPGYKSAVREITNSSSDTARVNVINNALTDEYAETGPETAIETASWLSGLNRKIKNLKSVPGEESVVGVGSDIHTPTPEMVIIESAKVGGLASYTYVYDHESPIADKIPKPDGMVRKEISFVTDLPDNQRVPDEMAEAFQQTAMMLWEIQAGKTISELSGSFTPDQLKEAQKLQIFTTAGDGPDETKYRDGLAQSGFKELGSYDEEGALQHVYGLDLDTLIAAMAEKKAAASK